MKESNNKKRKRVFVSYVNTIIPTLEIQQICNEKIIESDKKK